MTTEQDKLIRPQTQDEFNEATVHWLKELTKEVAKLKKDVKELYQE
jgi:hypothetical protein